VSLSVIIALSVFSIALFLIVFEVMDKSIIALSGALILLLTKVITFDQAIESINFEIIFLLAGMMMLVDVTRASGFFSWLNVKITTISKGNPFLIFLLFCTLTFFISAFLDNVTTIIIMIPITIELLRGMGKDPKPYVIAEIMLSNVGGAMTIIGDPTNVIIGTAAKLTFNQVIFNMAVPTLTVLVMILIALYIVKWDQLKPITKDFQKLFLSNILIKKVQYTFLSEHIDAKRIAKAVFVLVLTILGFIFQNALGLPLAVIALMGATLVVIISIKDIQLHRVLESVEWATLFFFGGLFIMVGALEHLGVLELIGTYLAGLDVSFLTLLIVIIWGAAIFSMLLDNVALVTVMVPIILNMQTHLNGRQEHMDLLWWSLALGAILGGNGTLIGASANVVGSGVAKKHGLNITFTGFLKYSLPITILALMVSTVYISIRYYFL